MQGQVLVCVVLSNVCACVQELKPLVYPLAQVLLGAVRLVPTPRYFPLRLRCIRALLALGKALKQFIPLSPLLLEMLQVQLSLCSTQPLLIASVSLVCLASFVWSRRFWCNLLTAGSFPCLLSCWRCSRYRFDISLCIPCPLHLNGKI